MKANTTFLKKLSKERLTGKETPKDVEYIMPAEHNNMVFQNIHGKIQSSLEQSHSQNDRQHSVLMDT